MNGEEGGSTGQSFRGTIVIFLSLAAVACGLTMLWLGMRAVLDIGGFCAEGGPFVIEHHCPKGVAVIMPLSIWGGVIAGGIYVWQTIKHRVPSLVWLFWPALFISLGFNFLQYAFDPPGGDGPVWGWLIPGVLFVLMGGVPLVLAFPAVARGFSGSERPRPHLPEGVSATTVRDALRTFASLRRAARSIRATTPTAPAATAADGAWEWAPGGLVAQLQQLDALHRSGALSDDEFERAKRAVLEGETKP